MPCITLIISLNLFQRLFKVGNKVVNILDTDTDTHHVFDYLTSGQVLAGLNPSVSTNSLQNTFLY